MRSGVCHVNPRPVIVIWDHMTPPRLGHGLDIRGKALAGIFGGMPPNPHKLAWKLALSYVCHTTQHTIFQPIYLHKHLTNCINNALQHDNNITNILLPIMPLLWVHAYMYTYIHTCIHTYVHTCMHARTHTYIRACMHTYSHAYIHTYMCEESC